MIRKFQARYGHKWTSAIEGIEGEVVREWSAGLAGITGEQVKRGLAEWNGEWPPTLPEFRAACLGKSLGLNEHGLDYVPEHLRQQPQRERSKLLSSDDREAQRAKLREGMTALKSQLRGAHGTERATGSNAGAAQASSDCEIAGGTGTESGAIAVGGSAQGTNQGGGAGFVATACLA